MAKTALITGASSGIGSAIAEQLSNRGFKVILCARREERLLEVAEKLNGESRVIVCDLSKVSECERLYNEVKDERISVLVNCAGFGKLGMFVNIPLESEIDMINTNVTALHTLTKLFIKDFVKADRGYILNVASSAGLMPGGPLMATYYATKAYVTSLTSSIYGELQKMHSNVHISALCPGPVDTEFNDVAQCNFAIRGITAEFCARAAVDGMFSRELIIIPEKKMRFVAGGSKFVPRKVLVRLASGVQSKKLK
ncbi:SDR family oxidoreductase [uncultured Ruminococcus sp.]|uniref:SDR family NAD(P)-dependent oxidoreductase n=1 Tax=uncultured Ruminococcus sp. TaxID=165186 RepID=UPI0025DED3A1|nr:SDR family oxidoreductase [uncultured Ruminococcus sp.]